MNCNIKIAVYVLLMFALSVNKRKFVSSQQYAVFQIFVKNSQGAYIGCLNIDQQVAVFSRNWSSQYIPITLVNCGVNVFILLMLGLRLQSVFRFAQKLTYQTI
jgi:hypothetical protein